MKWSLVAAGLATLLAVAAPAVVWLQSEAVIAGHYPLPSTTVAASKKDISVRRGAHLIQIAGCADCHGANLDGQFAVRSGVLDAQSTNLRIAAHTLSDEDFERAIRGGVAPDSTSMWIMPAMDYTFMSEGDLLAIVAYLRTLRSEGAPAPHAAFDMPARFAIARDDIEPVAMRLLDTSASIDLGPRYDGGRYLARIGCADCHGTDLAGTRVAPDLTIVGQYSRADFFALLHGGRTRNGRQIPEMSRPRFSAFYDYEADALYEYLFARATALSRTPAQGR